jgi:endo-1,4-beta-xylanase
MAIWPKVVGGMGAMMLAWASAWASPLVPVLLQEPVLPPGAETVASSAGLQVINADELGRMAATTPENAPADGVWQIDTLKPGPFVYSVQLGEWIRPAMNQGDVVWLDVWARAVKGQPETGEGRALFVIVTNGPEWNSSARVALNIPRRWKRFQVPIRIQHSRPGGQTLAAFQFGFSPQTVELAGFRLVRFPSNTPLGSLPRTRSDYPGQEANAPWRKAAEARIERIRKGDFTVTVTDGAGRPVASQNVTFRLQRHAFSWGTAVDSATLFLPGADGDRYRQLLKQHFNLAVIENHLKWPFYEEWGKEDGLRSVKWLRDNGFRVRGHNIIWPGTSNMPKDFPQLRSNPAALRQRIYGRIQDITGATKGMIDEWDVVNEPYTNNDVMQVLGWAEMATWFRLTKRADPKPILTLNDYPPLDGAAKTDAHLNHFYKTIGDLKKAGAPLEAIGFQCHVGGDVIPPERLLSGLDRFAKFGLPIQITEFDMDTQDRDLQRRYMRDFMTACFSHPAVHGVTQWGFWASRHWMPDAALWDREWRIQPHGQVYLDLINKEWTTTVTVRTDAQGRARFRGFYGVYGVQQGNRTGQTAGLTAQSRSGRVAVRTTVTQ